MKEYRTPRVMGVFELRPRPIPEKTKNETKEQLEQRCTALEEALAEAMKKQAEKDKP